MNKIPVILVFIMFLFSLTPVTLAEENDGRGVKAGVSDREIIDPYEKDFDLKNRIDKAKEIRDKELEEYNKLKEKYEDAREDYLRAKQRYLEIRDRIKDLRNNTTNSTDQDKIERVQTFLLKTLERMESHLEKLKEWTEKVVDDESLKQDRIAIIDKHIGEINDLKAKVKSADSMEELREVSKEIKEKWKEIRLKLHKVKGIILSHRLFEVIERSDDLYNEWKEKLDSLSQDNEDVKEMQSILEEFKDKVDEAEAKYNEAKGIYNSIEDKEDLEKVKSLLRESHEKLREAHKLFKELVEDYREFISGKEDDSDDDEDNENETEDDNEERTPEIADGPEVENV